MDCPVKIAVADRRTDKKYKNIDSNWSTVSQRCNTPIRTTETVEEYPRLPKSRQDAIKDCGGFVGGHLKGGLRKNGHVTYRYIGMLDADHVPTDVDFPALVKERLPDTEWFIYSTHKHTPEAPRFRLAVLLAREVSEDEYPALMRQLAHVLGMDLFDDSTYQANRMMYWPSAPSNGEFVFAENHGMPLDPDAYLSRYADWRDTSQWPVSSRQSEVIQRAIKQQADPLVKEGVVGAFCRAYSIEDAIETFLHDVYEPSAMDGRYDYIPADSSAGLVIYDSKFAYSHHATDPACGRLLNAFDLVRIHRFRDLDDRVAEDTPPGRLPSFKAMTELAVKDERVKEQFARERQAQAAGEFIEEDWQKGLELDRNGAVKDNFGNYLRILNHDPRLSGIVFNQLRNSVDVRGEIPWLRFKPGWAETDGAKLYEYLQNHFGIYAPTKTNHAVIAAAATRPFHPIREYLDSLPDWDGILRVETLMVDYFGAEETPYTRAVTRKTFAAAVARIYRPGIKFDYMLVINGETGLGKSTFFDKLAGEWYSDSLTFADMSKGKDAPEKIQGFWIIEIPELAGIRKADVNNVKAFLSRRDDNYRAAYGHVSESHPRQCIVVGSTNSESAGFLRDITGNRRFWPVRVSGKNVRRGWDVTDEDVLQIWAEAKRFWENGEKLYLEGAEAEAAVSEQAEAMESDEREGLVREYLDMLLPEDWDSLDIYRRRDYIRDQQDPTRPRGVNRRHMVSNIEIWCECLNKHREDIKTRDSYEITAIMQKMTDWRRGEKKMRMAGYGPQNIWLRKRD